MNEKGLSRDCVKVSLSIVLPRVALLATALLSSLGLAGSCAPATDGPGGTGGAGATGTGGITMKAGATGTAGATAGATGSCQAPPTLKLAWSIGIVNTSTTETCQQAGATSVQVLMNSIRLEYPCNDGAASTTTIPAGSYVARFILTANNGATILSQGTVPNLTIPACGTLDLGNVRFNVAAPSTGTAGTGGGGHGGNAGSSGAAGAGGSGGLPGGTGPCDAKPIFAMHSCTVAMACHDAAGAAAGLDMVTAGWETHLVGKLPNKSLGATGLRSQCDPVGGAYLVKGTPAKGLFLDKLRNPHQACGSQMPLITTYLTDAEMDCVQRWANTLTK